MTTVPVPPEQAHRFHLAACERLGVDPALVSRVDAEVVDDSGTLTVVVRLPGDEVRDLWNAAAEDAS